MDLSRFIKTIYDFHGTACSTTTTDLGTGAQVCSDQIQTLPLTISSSSPITILKIQASGTRSGNPLNVWCGPQNILNTYTNGIAYDVSIYCNDSVTWAFNSSISTDDQWFSMNYVSFALATSTMSTSTAYTSYDSWDGAIHYSYNPLLAQLGILSFIAIFILATFAVIKILKSW